MLFLQCAAGVCVWECEQTRVRVKITHAFGSPPAFSEPRRHLGEAAAVLDLVRQVGGSSYGIQSRCLLRSGEEHHQLEVFGALGCLFRGWMDLEGEKRSEVTGKEGKVVTPGYRRWIPSRFGGVRDHHALRRERRSRTHPPVALEAGLQTRNIRQRWPLTSHTTGLRAEQDSTAALLRTGEELSHKCTWAVTE